MEGTEQERVEKALEYTRSCKESDTFDVRKMFGLSEEEANIIEAKCKKVHEDTHCWSETMLALGLPEAAANPEFGYTLFFVASMKATDTTLHKVSGIMGLALMGKMFGKE